MENHEAGTPNSVEVQANISRKSFHHSHINGKYHFVSEGHENPHQWKISIADNPQLGWITSFH
jgi:hypothetical protein